MCAIWLCRGSNRRYSPLTNVCYLLHQAVEKWIKVVHAVAGIPEVNAKKEGHDLGRLLEPLEAKYPEFSSIRTMIEEVDGGLLRQRFPADLRYEEIMPEIERYVAVLMRAAFLVRRTAKTWLQMKGGS